MMYKSLELINRFLKIGDYWVKYLVNLMEGSIPLLKLIVLLSPLASCEN